MICWTRGLVPSSHWSGAQDRVDLATEAYLCPVGGVVDLGTLGGADDQDVDVIRRRPRGAVIAVGPGAEDDDLLDLGKCELLGDNGLRAEAELEQLGQGRGRRMGRVGADKAVAPVGATLQDPGIEKPPRLAVQRGQRRRQVPAEWSHRSWQWLSCSSVSQSGSPSGPAPCCGSSS